MTKRFELVWTDTGEVLHDNETGLDKGIYSPDYRFHVRDMMNELAEEKEQLKQQVDEMIIIFENSGLDYHISDELNEILNG